MPPKHSRLSHRPGLFGGVLVGGVIAPLLLSLV
jgi:hypothetical protein